MNQLTEKLLTQGHTKDSHPEYVEWTNWGHFEYTSKYLANTVWETPCGLLKNGIHGYSYGSYMGVVYCPENNNPRFGCPYYDEKPCQHRFNTKLMGWNCVYHQTDRPYDYERSVEKLWKEWDELKALAWRVIGGFCFCMVWDRPKRKYIPKYDPDKCVKEGCKNEVCLITRRPRNLEKVNIYYDVLREKYYRMGLIEDTERTIKKGIKVFPKQVARTDAEAWLQRYKDEITGINNEDYQPLYFSENHGKYGEYDYFNYKVTVQNIRIEKREVRDLLQDLRDAQEGIEVLHASDLIKKVKADKKAKRQQRKEEKERWLQNRHIKNLRRIAEEGINSNGEPASDVLKAWAIKELAKHGIEIEKQLSLL